MRAPCFCAQTLFFIELSFEEISGGSSLFARVDLSTAQSCLTACAAACVLGAGCAVALLPLAKQHLASASRGTLSRLLTSRCAGRAGRVPPARCADAD